MQTRVKRRCLGCVLYSLMHRYAEPGVRTCLHDFLLLSAPLIFIFIFLSFYFSISIYFLSFSFSFLDLFPALYALYMLHTLHILQLTEKKTAPGTPMESSP